MQCYTELLPPSGVTHSISAHFVGPESNNLIVVKTSLIQIFAVIEDTVNERTHLSLLAEYSLQGTVSALAKVGLENLRYGSEALLIAFRDAKLSLVEWDAAQHSISTISIHYYENNDVLLCPWSSDLTDCVTRLSVDPSNRCAAFNFNQNSLAVIPFLHSQDDIGIEDADGNNPYSEAGSNGNLNANDGLQHQTNGTSETWTPYSKSFVLPITALDPSLVHPIAMTFLHEYREPTIGVLYASQAQSMNMSPGRQDVLVYAVYTLDIQQKASTTLVSIQKLPNDLSQVMAIPAPIGGALLVGGNEVIHVDQSGKTSAIGVNEFSKLATNFPLVDQANLQLRLEGCQIRSFPGNTHELLIILQSGQFAVLSFQSDGRSVSGISMESLGEHITSSVFRSCCSTITCLSSDVVFIGSEEADSVLVSMSSRGKSLKRVTSRAGIAVNEPEEPDVNHAMDDLDDDDDNDDDIYGDGVAYDKPAQQSRLDLSDMKLQVQLACVAPITDMILGRPPKVKNDIENDLIERSGLSGKLNLALCCNFGKAGSLALLSQHARVKMIKTHSQPRANRIWALTSDASELEDGVRPFDDLLVIGNATEDENVQTSLLSCSDSITEKRSNDFARNDEVITAGRMINGSHAVVYSKDIRAYDNKFGLSQIFPVVDEDEGMTAKVARAQVASTHILLHMDDASIRLLKLDSSGDLDDVELPSLLPAEDITSASLYQDSLDFFKVTQFSATKDQTSKLVLATLTINGTLAIHPVCNLKIQLFQYAGVDYLTTHFTSDLPIPKHWKSKDTIREMCLTSLSSGCEATPYLIFRNSQSDIVIYQPYCNPNVDGAFSFVKIATHNGSPHDHTDEDDDNDEQAIDVALIPLLGVAGSDIVITTGRYPRLITKPTSSLPRIHRLDVDGVRHVSAYHDMSCNQGLVLINGKQELIFCELSIKGKLDFADWSLQKIELGESVTHAVFYPRTSSYVVATTSSAPFHLPRDDEWHPEWTEDQEKASPHFLPSVGKCSLKLISASSHSAVSEYDFESDEQILSMKCLNIEVSEQTHERRDMIVVGTGFIRGENVSARGHLYLFDIVDIVPLPDVPETDLKLKMVAREDVKGAVTALSSIGTQGFILASQGQKCMVRGLREDNCILPVAFMDLRYQVSVAKELAGTGITILGDAIAGMWLVGYSEEPYKMQLLGRDLTNPSVLAAEFLPQGKELFIIVADSRGVLRILQYDPENPKSDRGQSLLLRSTFDTGYFPTQMQLLPRTPTPIESLALGEDHDSDEEDIMQIDSTSSAKQQILATTQEGVIVLITPLSESTYRRLSALQTILATQLEQYCGLNPRAHRNVETDGVGGRGIIDGQLIKKWNDQSSQHKYNLADRVGGRPWELRSDLESIGGTGLGYL